MNIILWKKGKTFQSQKIINRLRLCSLCIFMTVLPFCAKTQVQNYDTILKYSVIFDARLGIQFPYRAIMNGQKIDKTLYYYNTPLYQGYLPISKKHTDTLECKYSVQLFCIRNENILHKNWILIHYVDYYLETWIRADGYMENDMLFFINYLKKRGVKKKNIHSLFSEWTNDGFFCYVDWHELLDCIFHNKTNKFYFQSIFLADILESEKNISDLVDNLNTRSTFSRLPLYIHYFNRLKKNEKSLKVENPHYENIYKNDSTTIIIRR